MWAVAVVGVDRCRDGWIAVVARDESVDVQYCETIAELRRVADAVDIDIPLGLSATGERRADVLARREPRGSRQHDLQRAVACVLSGRR
jgi:predicted RNase H-like nuclease